MEHILRTWNLVLALPFPSNSRCPGLQLSPLQGLRPAYCHGDGEEINLKWHYTSFPREELLQESGLWSHQSCLYKALGEHAHPVPRCGSSIFKTNQMYPRIREQVEGLPFLSVLTHHLVRYLSGLVGSQ